MILCRIVINSNNSIRITTAPRLITTTLNRKNNNNKNIIYSTKRLFSTSNSIQSSTISSISNEPVFFNKVTLLKSPSTLDSNPNSPQEYTSIPAFRVLDGVGKLIPELKSEWLEKVKEIPDEVLVRMYEQMLFLPSMVSLNSINIRS